MKKLLPVFALTVFAALIDASGNAALAQVSDINSAINKAGRGRMLSQRMARFYQAIAWGAAPPSGAAELEKARKEFVAGLQELSNAPENTPAIEDELELGKQQWMFFEDALQHRGDKSLAINVATTSERILEVMDSLTAMYERPQNRK